MSHELLSNMNFHETICSRLCVWCSRVSLL